MNVCVLSGGFGGAKFVRALVETLGGAERDRDRERRRRPRGPRRSTSLPISTASSTRSPASLDEQRGWGRADETWNALETVSRARRRGLVQARRPRPRPASRCARRRCASGEPLSAFTRACARALGVDATLLPATDDELRTFVVTPAGTFSFQEWFVARGHRDEVDAVDVRGDARPGPGRARRARRPPTCC